MEVESLHYVVDNWKTVAITMTPSLEEQDRHTHDMRDKYIRLRNKRKYDYISE
jgi:hypothetical protein